MADYEVRTDSRDDNDYGYMWSERTFTIIHLPTNTVVCTLTGRLAEYPPDRHEQADGYRSVEVDGDDLVLTDWSGTVTREPIANRRRA